MEKQTVNEYPAQILTNLSRMPNRKDEIDLVEVFYMFLGHLWQIVLCLLVWAGAAFGITY